MLSNAYFLAKFSFDTAENEPAKNLQNFANFPNFANPNSAKSLEFSRAQVGGHVGNSPGPQILLLWRWSEHFEAGLEAYFRMDPKFWAVRSRLCRCRIEQRAKFHVQVLAEIYLIQTVICFKKLF